MGAKFFKKTERPLSAVEVSLVTLPPVEAKPEPKVERLKAVPKPAPKPVHRLRCPCLPNRYRPDADPPPPVQAAPVAKPAPPAPTPPRFLFPVGGARVGGATAGSHAAKSPSSKPVTNRADVLLGCHEGRGLPLNAPKYGDIAPMKPAEVKKSPAAQVGGAGAIDVDAMLKKLNVPDMAAPRVSTPQSRRSRR